jgi:hypothetical protein
MSEPERATALDVLKRITEKAESHKHLIANDAFGWIWPLSLGLLSDDGAW